MSSHATDLAVYVKSSFFFFFFLGQRSRWALPRISIHNITASHLVFIIGLGQRYYNFYRLCIILDFFSVLFLWLSSTNMFIICSSYSSFTSPRIIYLLAF